MAESAGDARATTHPAVHLRPADWRRRVSYFDGSEVALILDPSIDGADMYGGLNVLAPGKEIPRHWHHIGEFQFILAGSGLALGAEGSERPVEPHSTIFSPAGPAGVHGFRNTGLVPMVILFLYPSAGGAAPELILEDA